VPHDIALRARLRQESEPEAPLVIQEYLHLLRRRWRLIAVFTFLAVFTGLVHFFISPSRYRATTTIQVGQRSPISFGSDPNPWLEAWASVKYYPTQYRLLKSRGLAEQVVLDLRLAEAPGVDGSPMERERDVSGESSPDSAVPDLTAVLAARLLANLDINPVAETELVEISFVSSEPSEAARVANAFADAYIDWGIKERTQTVGKASVFLTEQIETLKSEIDEKEQQLEESSRTKDIINLDPSTNVTLQRLEQLNTEYTRALRDRFERQARYNELKDTPGDALADDPMISELQREVLRLEPEYASKLDIYKPDWPEMIDLSSEIRQTRERLDSAIEEQAQGLTRSAYAEYQTALREEQALDAQIRRVRKDAMNLNSAAVELRDLQMEITNKRSLLDDLLKRRAETGVSANLQGTREPGARADKWTSPRNRHRVTAPPPGPNNQEPRAAGEVARAPCTRRHSRYLGGRPRIRPLWRIRQVRIESEGKRKLVCHGHTPGGKERRTLGSGFEGHRARGGRGEDGNGNESRQRYGAARPTRTAGGRRPSETAPSQGLQGLQPKRPGQCSGGRGVRRICRPGGYTSRRAQPVPIGSPAAKSV
jgi:uncharacterized protein involved in exopolysaccharide biosynthesis